MKKIEMGGASLKIGYYCPDALGDMITSLDMLYALNISITQKLLFLQEITLCLF